jgi:hypothetical protein
MTPDGLGIHLRQSVLLKYLSRLRGKRIEGTPFFEKFSDQDSFDPIDHSRNHLNIVNKDKFHKDEKQIPRHRRAKRS